MAQSKEIAAFCRDCLTPAISGETRCGHCHSPRIIAHEELYELTIAHLDCDAFYASVEKRDNPELQDKPLIIGGGRRGVVSTACYLARIHGVHSAMPMYKALKLCPRATVLPPDMAKYSAVSREVRALMHQVTPLVEPLSIDEAFMDLSGTQRLHGRSPAETLAALARQIEAEIGISVSIGLSHNKFLAKVASDMDKPRGFAVIGKAETLSFLKNQPVSLIYGVGKAFKAKLARDGITTIGQLQTISEEDLFRRYGQVGQHISRLAKGQDNRLVKPDRPTKSQSTETTFDRDISDQAVLEATLWRLCEKLSARLKVAKLNCTTITLKLKTSSFQTITRAATMAQPDNHAETLFREGQRLLHPLCDGTAFRLIGIGGSHFRDLDDSQQLLFTAQNNDKSLKAEDALDKIRAKFGTGVISKGRGLKSSKREER